MNSLEATLSPTLPIPAGQTEASLHRLFGSLTFENGHSREIEAYWRQDWKRFIYTYGLITPLKGSVLELGANPYFTTILLKNFTDLELTLANYFGPQFGAKSSQTISALNVATQTAETHRMDFHHFNIEEAQFPFPDAAFDAVLMCEVLEHLQSDPVKVMREIKRILKPAGHLVLTTPNVSRLENVSRIIAGENIYDPYSGYGPYGRHNREYNKHDLARLLDYCGFDLEVMFSADVHENHAANYAPLERITGLVEFRASDLGQYLFSRSSNSRPAGTKLPAWLYRSYPADKLEP